MNIRIETTCAETLPSETLRQMRERLFDLFCAVPIECQAPPVQRTVEVLNNANATSREVFDAFINLHRALHREKQDFV